MDNQQNSGRDLAMMLGGIALGVLGSRLLPPIGAALSGMIRSRSGQDPFDLLIEDHRKILLVLDEMVDAPADATLERSKLFLQLKRKLAKHAMAEEDVVYPILESNGSEQQGTHLYEEHADMKVALFKLEEKLMAGEDWSDTARSLREVIRHHAREEEEQVFPKLRQAVGRKRYGKLSSQIRREEALVL